jgi:hypothetical protein
MALEVPRRCVGGDEDAGVFRMTIALPPELSSDTRIEREPGTIVGVVGMLTVETDYSTATPRARYAIVAEAIERVPAMG